MKPFSIQKIDISAPHLPFLATRTADQRFLSCGNGKETVKLQKLKMGITGRSKSFPRIDNKQLVYK